MLALPPFDPGTLIVLVGGSGSGKTTLATRLWPTSWCLSLDDYREMATDSAADQSATPVADQIQTLLLDARLSRNLTTVADSTALYPHVRAALLARARYWQRPCAAVLLDVPLEIRRSRNSARSRVVPDHVLADQQHHVPTADQLAAEGFARVDTVPATPALIPAQAGR
ncbi:AAA family ATPase [Kitasatospora sp. NPDC051853]|uniref:AAA family ATPase n=1 Tax=Kitasatospora sp. NPDC051853 TaxID=3364058 RepID=UPI0037A5B92B